MKTCSKVDAAGGGFKEMYRLQMHVCAFVSSRQWRRDLGQKAKQKQQKVPELKGSLCSQENTFSQHKHDRAVKICFFFSPVEIS